MQKTGINLAVRLLFIHVLVLLMAGCDKQPIGPTEPDPVTPGTFMPISEFRKLFIGPADMLVPEGTKRIRGVVISNNANEAAGNYRVQDESGAGIYLYTVQGSPVYPMGTILEIDAAGVGVLTLYNGDLELKNVPSSRVVQQQGTMNITPRITTAQQVIDSMEKWASSLVTLNNVTIMKEGAGNSTGQNYRITDATGSVVSFVRNTLGTILPEGGADSFTGYVSIYQPGTNPAVTQLTIRTAADVVNGGQGGGGGNGINLGTSSPYTINFNSIGNGLPAGVTVATGASATSAGTSISLITSPSTSLWNRTASGFKNFASATGLHPGSDSTEQVNSLNRALGVRQTSAAGFDPGAAFIFLLNNTQGKTGLKMDFLLQSLDTSSIVTRTTTWTVDYALGDNPVAFTPVSATGIMTTGNKVFSNENISVSFPSAVDNQAQKLWIRIVTLTPTSGVNNRPSTAIDDVQFSWN